MNKDSPRVIMAFDFGTKNIGIAIGQEITKTASTFTLFMQMTAYLTG